jgi:hypothetical protein
MVGTDTAGLRTFAGRLNHLFRSVRPDGRREFSNDEVCASIARDQGIRISASYIWYLRTGQRDNPTFKHVAALAAFFGVPAGYFFDEETGRRVEAELAMMTAMQDAGVRSVALRAEGLSAASLEAIADVLDRVRQLEGLPVSEPPVRPE